mmetsp:Transcript_155424/g.496943  ORF Transcript_155424/g.496943 Transcript_155424/m.496943 type:complete len:510 (+) Transcript_155424:153-1682(+)
MEDASWMLEGSAAAAGAAPASDGPGRFAAAKPEANVFKLLASRPFAEAVAGASGLNLVKLREETGCSVLMSAWGDTFPGTEDQVITCMGPTHDALRDGVLAVVRQWELAPDFDRGADVSLRFVAPQKMSSMIIGRGGENVKALFRNTRIKAFVDMGTYGGTGQGADQLVTMFGPVEGIPGAVSMMLEHMQELSIQPWYPEWAARLNQERSLPEGHVPSPLGDGKGGSKGMMGKGGCGGCGCGSSDPFLDPASNPGAFVGVPGLPPPPPPPPPMGGKGKVTVPTMSKASGLGKGACSGGGGPGGFGGSGGGTFGGGAGGRGPIATFDGRRSEGGPSGMEVLSRVLQIVPSNVAEDPRGFSLRFALHGSLIDGIVGHNSQPLQEVESACGVKIDIARKVLDGDHRAMSVTGPLFGNVSAYIRMMKRYLEAEGWPYARSQRPPAPPPNRSAPYSGGGGSRAGGVSALSVLQPKAAPPQPPQEVKPVDVASRLEAQLRESAQQMQRWAEMSEI